MTEPYSPDPSERIDLFASTADHLAPIRTALALGRDASFEAGLARMLTRPDWVRACIMPHDALVLAEFIRAIRPSRVLEIGTASGVSAAGMLWAMDAAGCAPTHTTAPWIDSFDISTTCYFDPARPTGSAARHMVPHLASNLRVHHAGAREARSTLAGPGVGFRLAFIDACHDHPWPTLDLLWIAPLLEPGAWVVLHDVAYARILDAKRAREGKPPKRSEFGPEALFEAWAFEKVLGDGWAGNIGAIRIPDPAAITPDLLRVSLDRAWEATPTPGEIPPDMR